MVVEAQNEVVARFGVLTVEQHREVLAAELEAMAHTMTYDSEVMGASSTGGAVPTDLAGRVTTETLVLCGGASPEWMIDVGTRLAESLPNGRHCVLEGQEHVVPPEVLVPVLAEFFVDRNRAHHPTESRKKPRLPTQIPRPDTPR
jgi:hypothetical protein